MLDDGMIPGGIEWSNNGVNHSVPTLRDQFAMAALTGLLARRPKDNNTTHPPVQEGWSRTAYEFADAMIAARMPDLSGLNDDAIAMLAARGGK